MPLQKMGDQIQSLRLRKGMRVEVCSNEEGFKGIWFGATVVETPKYNSRYCLIQYDNLVAEEDDSKLLTEKVHASYIRPLPPPPDSTNFEMYDAVEAFYRDGWWTGKVTKILEEGKFVVSFDDTPDKIEFHTSQLRPHLEWVDGKWVKPKPQNKENNGLISRDSNQNKRGRKPKSLEERQKGGGSIRGKGSNDNQANRTVARKRVKRLKISMSNGEGQKRSTTVERVSPDGSLEQCALNRQDDNEIPSSAIASDDSAKSYPIQKSFKSDSDSGVLPVRNLDRSAEASDNVASNQTLPFVKCSPLWETVENMEIFHKTPQKPHFSPLLNFREETREGFAIAQMVTFFNVVESMSKLQGPDPRSIIERNLETLTYLECHGFDVGMVRVRLNELLSKKERELELQDKSKEIENEIMKDISEKAKFDKQINVIILKMTELEEKLKTAMSMREVKDKKISSLKSKLDVLCESIKRVQRDFENVLASPL